MAGGGEAPIGGAEPTAVRLRLNRRFGWGLYGTLTVVVFLLVVAGAASNVLDGRYGMAAVIAVLGLAMTAFLALVTRTLVMPELTVSATGVSGRTPRGATVDAGWHEITLDVDEEAPDAIRLDVGGQSVSISAQSWVGCRDLVVLLARTPDAVARLTPAARLEVVRLLQEGGRRGCGSSSVTPDGTGLGRSGWPGPVRITEHRVAE